MKSQFKELIVDNLRMFIDQFIETPHKVGHAEEDLLAKFIRQPLLAKRALSLQQQLAADRKLIKTQQKKIELHEMTIMSLKHKVRAAKWEQQNHIE